MSNKNKWISVNEKLPKDESTVLVLIKGVERYGENKEKKDIYYWMCTGFYDGVDWATNYCFGCKYLIEEESEYPDVSLKVTHWRPLPPLPENIKFYTTMESDNLER